MEKLGEVIIKLVVILSSFSFGSSDLLEIEIDRLEKFVVIKVFLLFFGLKVFFLVIEKIVEKLVLDIKIKKGY